MSIPSLPIPAWLKPENGPVGRGLGAFLDNAPAGVSGRVVLMWFVILYTAFAIVTSGALGVDPESLQSFVLGLHPAAGYPGYEPLAPWLMGAWFRVFPRVDWAFHLLATLNAGIGLFFAHRIARLFLDGDKAIAALLLLLLTPLYTIMGQSLDPAATMLATWPAATFCFLRAFATRDLMWSALAGVTAALAVLGDYHSLLLVAGFALAVLADPRRASWLWSAAPWLALAVTALALAPHAVWLWGELQRMGFAALGSGSPPGPIWSGLPVMGLSWTVVGAWSAAILLVVCLLAVGGRGVRDAVNEPDGRLLLVILAVPLVLPFLAAPFVGAGVLRAWPAAAPWFLVPVILFRPAAAILTRTAAIRIAALVAATTLVTLASAPWLAWHPGETQGREFYQRVAAETTKAWRLATGQPLRAVTGDPALAAAVAFYSPDRPEPETAPAGDYVAICPAADDACTGPARQRVAGNTGVQINTYSALSPYPGKTDRLGRFLLVLVPRPGSRLINVPDAPR